MSQNIGRPGFTGESVPMAAGSLFGLRAFSVDPEKGTLHGVAFPQKWDNGENTATCRHPQLRMQEHSMTECEHGFWSYYGDHAEYLSLSRAAGIIEGYGEVVIGEKGFRAEKARIRAAVLPSPSKLAGDTWILMNGLLLLMQLYKREFLSSVIAVIASFLIAVGALGAVYFAVPEMNLIANITLVIVFIGGIYIVKDATRAYIEVKARYEKNREEMNRLTSGEFNQLAVEKIKNKEGKEELNHIASESLKKTKELYPDIKFYHSMEEMMSDYRDKITTEQASII